MHGASLSLAARFRPRGRLGYKLSPAHFAILLARGVLAEPFIDRPGCREIARTRRDPAPMSTTSAALRSGFCSPVPFPDALGVFLQIGVAAAYRLARRCSAGASAAAW